MVNLTRLLQWLTLRYGQVMERMLDAPSAYGPDWQATGADLSAQEGAPTQPPTPTGEPAPAVQPPTTQDPPPDGAPDGAPDVDTYRRMQAADPHLQAGTPLGNVLRTPSPWETGVRISQEAGPSPTMQDWLATQPPHHVYRVELWVDGQLRRTITTDVQGCAPTLDIHQGRTMEEWAHQGRRPTCTHFSVTTCD